MNIQGTTIIQMAQYAAPYLGNFIKSLMELETQVVNLGGKMIYVFPPAAAQCAWYNDFAKKHNVQLIDVGERGIVQIKSLLEGIQDNIVVHTHFEGYDLLAYKAIKKCGRHIPMVWHLHDHLSYQKNIVKALYQRWCFVRHYFLPTLHAPIYTIGVSDEVSRFVHGFHGRYRASIVLPNGIDASRIYRTKDWSMPGDGVQRFVCLGGRNVQKRMDIALQAFKMLFDNGRLRPGSAKLRVVKGTDSDEVFARVFGEGALPEWLDPIEQNEDIVQVFGDADCFISAAQHETFSYAVCEATLYGLAVIQSDIEGTRWNADNPSVTLFHSCDSADLAEKIAEFVKTDRSTLAVTTTETMRRNRAKYTLKSWCNSVIDFYKHIDE